MCWPTPLSVAALQRGQDREGGRQAGRVVVEGEAGAEITTAGRIGEVGETRQGVDGGCVGDEARPGALVTTAGHGDVDEPGVPPTDLLVGEPPAVEDAGGEVLDQHVALLDQPSHDAEGTLVLHAEGDRPLGAVPRVEVRVARVVDRDRPFDRLDLHDVGAQVPQQARGHRPGQDVAQVEHPQAAQRFVERAPTGRVPAVRTAPAVDYLFEVPFDTRGAGFGIRSAVESGERSGHQHSVTRPVDRPEEASEVVLGVHGHLGHRLDLAEGDVTLLGGVEQGARVHGPGEGGDGV